MDSEGIDVFAVIADRKRKQEQVDEDFLDEGMKTIPFHCVVKHQSLM